MSDLLRDPGVCAFSVNPESAQALADAYGAGHVVTSPERLRGTQYHTIVTDSESVTASPDRLEALLMAARVGSGAKLIVHTRRPTNDGLLTTPSSPSPPLFLASVMADASEAMEHRLKAAELLGVAG